MQRHVNALSLQLAEMRRFLDSDHVDCASVSVSEWCASEHIEHMAKVTAAILDRIATGKPMDGSTISWSGRLVLLLGWIPRGKAKAPKEVRPVRVSVDEIRTTIDQLQPRLATLDAALFGDRVTPRVRHPYFGALTAVEGLRFIVVHNQHHLKIVRDIVRKR